MSSHLPTSPRPADDPALAVVAEALKGVRYGVVQIIVQDGRVVQIDKTEKIRLSAK